MLIEDLVGKRTVVNCKTESEANRFLQLVEDAGGMGWLMFTERDFYKSKGYQIIDSTEVGNRHPDAGKKVRWVRGKYKGTGTLLAVNYSIGGSSLVKRDDSGGWMFSEDDCDYEKLKALGLKLHTQNLYWVDSYEVISEERAKDAKDPNYIFVDVGDEATFTECIATFVNYKKPLFSNPFKMGTSVLDKFRSITRSEPQKTYVKVGLLDERGNPTQEGIEFVVAHLLSEKDTELFNKAKQVLKEMEK